MSARVVEYVLFALDAFLHWSLDRHINRQRLGWERLQLWQWHVCNAYERSYDRLRPSP